MKKVLKAILIILIITAVLAACWFFVVPILMSSSGYESKAAVTRVGDIHTAESFLSNRYSAVIESQEIVSVDSDIEKKVKTVFVKVGDEVKKGDKLFEYDIEDMSFRLDQSKLELEQAEAEIKSYNDQIATLEKEYKNSTKNRRLSLENQIEATKLNLKKAEYSKDSLTKDISKLENSLKSAVVKASVNGTIRTVDDPTAEAYITITSSGDLRVKATVSEGHIKDFSVDDKLTIRSRTDERVTWTGAVVSIDTAKPIVGSSANSLDVTTKYPVYISLDSTDGLLIGQHVTVEKYIDLSRENEGLWVDAYYICDIDSAPYVWVDEGGVLMQRSVKLGEYHDDTLRYNIESGVTENDYIAFPTESLYEGMMTSRYSQEATSDNN